MHAIDELTLQAVDLNHQIVAGEEMIALYERRGDFTHIPSLNATLDELKAVYKHKMDAIDLIMVMDEEIAAEEIVVTAVAA